MSAIIAQSKGKLLSSKELEWLVAMAMARATLDEGQDNELMEKVFATCLQDSISSPEFPLLRVITWSLSSDNNDLESFVSQRSVTLLHQIRIPTTSKLIRLYWQDQGDEIVLHVILPCSMVSLRESLLPLNPNSDQTSPIGEWTQAPACVCCFC